MGISSSKSTSTNKPVYEKQIMGAYDGLQGAVNNNQQNVNNIQGGLQSVLGGLQGQAMGTDGLTQAARGYAGDVLGRKYLGSGNPYLNDIAGLSRQNAFNDISSAFGRSGMTGSTGFGESLGRGINQAELGVRYGDYNAERGRMDQFANNAGSIANSNLPAAAAYSGIAGQAAELPLLGARTVAQGAGSLLGQYGTQTQTQNPSLFSSIMQGLGTAAQFASLSDARAKEDIRHVGMTDGGLPVYTYRYAGDDTPQMGVMAQDVAQLQPHALGPMMGDFMTVKYGDIT